jgi:hypothetical protein
MATELQDLLYEFVKERMTEEEQRSLTTSATILNKLDEESEEELKTELFHRLLKYINWSVLIRHIHASLPEQEDEDEEVVESEEEEYDDSH